MLFGQTPRPPAFDAYAAHLGANVMSTACPLGHPSAYRNLAYPFRAKAYPGRRMMQFKDGRNVERVEPTGAIEWSTDLRRQASILLGPERAVLLEFFASHVGGTGSVAHVLVVRCRNARLEIVFEAGGEGMRPSFSRNGALRVTHPTWRGSDSHAVPSRVVDERYQWDARRGQFVLWRRSEGEASASPGGAGSTAPSSQRRAPLRSHLS